MQKTSVRQVVLDKWLPLIHVDILSLHRMSSQITASGVTAAACQLLRRSHLEARICIYIYI